jgi:hypothetical protein
MSHNILSLDNEKGEKFYHLKKKSVQWWSSTIRHHLCRG